MGEYDYIDSIIKRALGAVYVKYKLGKCGEAENDLKRFIGVIENWDGKTAGGFKEIVDGCCDGDFAAFYENVIQRISSRPARL